MDDSNFFFKPVTQAIRDEVLARGKLVGTTQGAVRKAAYVEIYTENMLQGKLGQYKTGKYSRVLPWIGEGIDDTYSKSTGKPAPTLGTVTVEIDGEFGSLRRATAEFTCYDMESFDQIESSLLRPGKTIYIRYGYAGANSTTDRSQGLVDLGDKGKAYEFVIYDYSFTYTKENYVKCSFKAVGSGNLSQAINFSNKVEAGTRKFLRNFEEADSEAPVQGIEDVFDYDLLNNVIGVGNKVESVGDSKSYSGVSIDGYATNYTLSMLILPKDLELADAIVETNWANSSYIAYCSLGYIVHQLINTELLQNNKSLDPSKLGNIRYVCNKDTSISKVPSVYMFSADPLNVGLTGNWYQNAYGKIGEPAAEVFTFEILKFQADQKTINVDNIDISNILISRVLLRKILKNFEKDKFSINSFLQALFDAIKDATAGLITLGLYEPDLNSNDPDEKKLYNKYSMNGAYVPVLIKNLKQKPNTVPDKLEFDPLKGDGITRSCEVTAKVPKDMAAEAFGRQTPGKIGSTGTDGGQISEVIEGTSSKPLKDISEVETIVGDLKYKIYPENKLSGTAVTAGKGFLKDLINVYTALETRLQSEQILYPLEMKLTLDGIEGFRFGDHISSTNIPSVYRKKAGMRVGFTVLKTTHTITANDWSTELTTIARLVN
jgi:hypothetical protein